MTIDLSFDFLRGHSVTAADLALVKEEEVPTDVPIRKASTTFSYPDINFQIDGNQPSATSSVGYSTAIPELSSRGYRSTPPDRRFLKPTNDIDRSVATSPTPPPIPSARHSLRYLPRRPPHCPLQHQNRPLLLSRQRKPQEPTPLAKEKGKSCWMPFNSEEEALRWARKLPHGEAGRLMSALTTEGMETHPPPVAPFLKWSPLEAQVIRDDRHNDAAGIQRPRNEPADENSMKSVFELLPTDWQASLKASIEDSREFAGFQVGMISSAALESSSFIFSGGCSLLLTTTSVTLSCPRT
ncbi:hypothetical protein BKA70DRAFT_1218695 [Coprinopsis sp. MPI-PUGE-AT-0042]|nr:hypothetical protein BKA70DRAFT_1218695 [Coprinopsis sp. MPI-PUGE-AT-0042]